MNKSFRLSVSAFVLLLSNQSFSMARLLTAKGATASEAVVPVQAVKSQVAEKSQVNQAWQVNRILRFDEKYSGLHALSCEFSPDGKSIAIARSNSWVNEIAIIDAQTGDRLKTFRAYFDSFSFAFSKNWEHLAITGKKYYDNSNKNFTVIFDVKSGEQVVSVPVRGESVAFSADGKRLVTSEFNLSLECCSSSFKVWDVATGKLVRHFTFNDSGAKKAVFSADGQHIIAVHSKQVCRWNIQNGKRQLLFTFNEGELGKAGEMSADGSKIIFFDSYEERALVVCLETGAILTKLWCICEPRFTPDGKQVIGINRGIEFWDAQTGLENSSADTRVIEGNFTKVAASSQGSQFASMAETGVAEVLVSIWDHKENNIQAVKDQKIKLPSLDSIHRFLGYEGLGYFMEKTGIAGKLANRELSAAEIEALFDVAIVDFHKYMGGDSREAIAMTTIMGMSKKSIVESLVKRFSIKEVIIKKDDNYILPGKTASFVDRIKSFSGF